MRTARATGGPRSGPLYAQVKDHIARRIRSGEWPAGHRLPSEHELVAQFDVSRMTAHRALRELAGEGRIVRVAGSGSFVAEDKPQSTLLRIAHIGHDVRARGHDYGFRLVAARRAAATREAAQWLSTRAGEPLFHCVCVHLEDGRPVQLEDRWVVPRLAPRFLDQDFSREPPSEWLVRNVPYDEVEHLVDAVLPDADEARRLGVARRDPCLLLTRRTWTRGTPITFVRCLHPAARYRLGSRFRTDAQAGHA